MKLGSRLIQTALFTAPVFVPPQERAEAILFSDGLELRNGQTKYLLKRLLCRYLPEKLVYQPKRGFGMPVASWLRGPLRGWAEQLINERSLFEGTPIDQESMKSLLALHSKGVRDASPLLWSSLMLLCFIACHERGLSLPQFDVTERAA